MSEPPPIPRFWWLKRLVAIFVAVVVLMIAAHLVLNWWMGRRVERLIAQFEQMPVLKPEDLEVDPAVMDDPRNPAHHVDKAFGLLTPMTAAEDQWYEDQSAWKLVDEEDLAVMKGIVARDAAALRALRAARGHEVDGQMRWALGPYSMMMGLPNLSPAREMSRRLAWATQVAWDEGDLAEVIELVRDTRLLAASAVEYGPSLVSALVAVSIQDMQWSTLLRIAQHHPREEGTQWHEARDEVKQIISLLLDDALFERTKAASLETEWLYSASLADSETAQASGVSRNFFVNPSLDLGIAAHLERLLEVHEVWQTADSYQEIVRRLDRGDSPPTEGDNVPGHLAQGWALIFADITVTRAMLTFYRERTVAHATAIALAVRLYEANHDGQLPETLADLVPDYLPHIPADPMDPEGGHFRYAKLADMPVIYSVGENGIDDGGSVEVGGGDPRPNVGRDWVYPLRLPHPAVENPYQGLLEHERLERQ